MSVWLAETLIATTLLMALVMMVRQPVARWLGAGAAYMLWALPLARMVLPALPDDMADPSPLHVGMDHSGLPAMRAIGVTPISAVLAGESTLEQAVSSGQAETRQYIKRQETWLKRHMIAWKCIKAQYLESNMRDIFAFIRG